jgi:photosystem II stability/assembly factor-like uncharacterized protein
MGSAGFRVPLALGVSLLAVTLPLAAGIDRWTSVGPTGGRVEVVALDPSDPATLYAGTATGLFKTTDGGRRWVELAGGLPKQEVLAVALDAEDPATIYVSLGWWSGVFRSRDAGRTFARLGEIWAPSFLASAPRASAGSATGLGVLYAVPRPPYDSGLFKSVDGGETWEPVLWLQYPTSLVVHPARPLEVLVAGGRGIARSVDGGVHWTLITEDALGDPLGSVNQLARAPSDPRRAYASVASEAKFFASMDGGRSWRPKPPLPLRCEPTTLAVHPSDPDVVYLGCRGELLLSRDGGGSWSVVAADLPLGLDHSGAKAALVIDPDRPEVLYAGTWDAGVLKSHDGGGTWVQASTGIDLPHVEKLAFDPRDPLTFYTATYYALERTTDGGRSWEQRFVWPPEMRPYPSDWSSSGILALDPTDPDVLYLVAGGALYRSPDGGSAWSRLAEGYAEFVAVDGSEPQRLYTGGDGLSVSSDGGRTWRRIASGPVFNFLLDPAHPGTLFAEFETGQAGYSDPAYFRSLDGGETWREIGDDDLQIAPGEPSTIYLGCAQSTDAGETWHSLQLPRGAGPCTRVLAVPTQPPTLYATTATAIYRSADGGERWVRVAPPEQPGPFPAIGPYTVAHPAAPDRIYGPGSGGGLFTIQLLGAEPLLLGDGRFEVRAGFRDLMGRYGPGRPAALTTDAGSFTWRQAPRQVVKVLDGRPANGHYWVLSGALSPFECTLTVVDRASGVAFDLFQPAGPPASRADFRTLPPLPEEPGPALPPAAGAALAGDAGGCVPDRATLCLAGGRFQARLAWRGPAGNLRQAAATAFADDLGAFWWSSPNNLELAVRIADGREVNGRFWVLGGGLTDLEYDLTVTDLATGAVRLYHNQAETFASFADFEAFLP